MKFTDLLIMSKNNLLRRKSRTFLTVLGVVIGTASIVVMLSLGVGMNRANMEMIERYGGLTTIEVYPSDSNNYFYRGDGDSSKKSDEPVRINDEMIETLKKISHVSLVSPVLTANVVAKQGAYTSTWMNLMGMDADCLQELGLKAAEGSLPKSGEQELKLFYGNTVITNFVNEKKGDYYWQTGVLPDVNYMGKPMYIIFDTDAYWASQGSGVDEKGQKVARPKKYMIEACGVMEGGPDDYNNNSSNVYCDIKALETMLKRVFKNKKIPGQPTTKSGKPYKEIFYTNAFVKVDDVSNMKAVQQEIKNLGLQASSNTEWIEQTQEQSKTLQMVLGGIGLVSMLIAAISIANTMTMAIYERTKEIGIFKVLGCGLDNIRNMFLIEAGCIGFLGGIAGIILSALISFVINFFAVRSMGQDYSHISSITLPLILLGLAFSVCVGMVAGVLPAFRAMRLSPLAAIKNE